MVFQGKIKLNKFQSVSVNFSHVVQVLYGFQLSMLYFTRTSVLIVCLINVGSNRCASLAALSNVTGLCQVEAGGKLRLYIPVR